jgi:hypothetical protein
MTDQNDLQKRGGGTTSGSLGGQGVDIDENEERDDALGLGNARPGAGSNWQPGTAAGADTSGSSGISTSVAGTTSGAGTTSSMGGGGSSSGGGVSSGAMSDPVVGGQDTETQPGSWGNRSGSGSGGEGERELDEESTAAGGVSDDITGTNGTNG